MMKRPIGFMLALWQATLCKTKQNTSKLKKPRIYRGFFIILQLKLSVVFDL